MQQKSLNSFMQQNVNDQIFKKHHWKNRKVFWKKDSVGIEQMVLWIRIDDKTEDIVDT